MTTVEMLVAVSLTVFVIKVATFGLRFTSILVRLFAWKESASAWRRSTLEACGPRNHPCIASCFSSHTYPCYAPADQMAGVKKGWAWAWSCARAAAR